MKTKLKNRKIQEDGWVVLNDDAVIASLFASNKLVNCSVSSSEDVSTYNKWAEFYDMPILPMVAETIDHTLRCQEWMMPDSYKQLDMVEYLLGKCHTDKQLERVNYELSLYLERDMLNHLRYMKYLVDTLRANKIVWGIGRGSSVSSYILYLIGIHRVDSLKFNLDIREFLK